MSLAADFSVFDSASAHNIMRLGPQSLGIRLNMLAPNPTFDHNPQYLSSTI